MFNQSFHDIHSRLSSFKDTFEILRLRLNSYEQDIPKVLTSSPDPLQYSINVGMAVKDAQGLKMSKLKDLLSQLPKDIPLSTQALEKFNMDYSNSSYIK